METIYKLTEISMKGAGGFGSGPKTNQEWYFISFAAARSFLTRYIEQPIYWKEESGVWESTPIKDFVYIAKEIEVKH